MNPTIYKYEFDIEDQVKIDLPAGAEFLKCGLDPKSRSCMWFIVERNPSAIITRKFRIFGTGHILPRDILDANRYRHLGTFIQSIYVWHVFEDFT